MCIGPHAPADLGFSIHSAILNESYDRWIEQGLQIRKANSTSYHTAGLHNAAEDLVQTCGLLSRDGISRGL